MKHTLTIHEPCINPLKNRFFPAHHPLQVTAKSPSSRQDAADAAKLLVPRLEKSILEEVEDARIMGNDGMMGNAIFRPIWPK